jgi:hypothetical protein
MAKPEIRVMYVQYEPENRVCQRTNSCETDFAISIKNDEDQEIVMWFVVHHDSNPQPMKKPTMDLDTTWTSGIHRADIAPPFRLTYSLITPYAFRYEQSVEGL